MFRSANNLKLKKLAGVIILGIVLLGLVLSLSGCVYMSPSPQPYIVTSSLVIDKASDSIRHDITVYNDHDAYVVIFYSIVSNLRTGDELAQEQIIYFAEGTQTITFTHYFLSGWLPDDHIYSIFTFSIVCSYCARLLSFEVAERPRERSCQSSSFSHFISRYLPTPATAGGREPLCPFHPS